MFSPITSSSPELGRSMAAIMFSKVVFPDPEGPISARNSPPAMSMETLSSAVTSKASRLKILLTPRAWTTLLPTVGCLVGVVVGIALIFFVSPVHRPLVLPIDAPSLSLDANLFPVAQVRGCSCDYVFATDQRVHQVASRALALNMNIAA